MNHVVLINKDRWRKNSRSVWFLSKTWKHGNSGCNASLDIILKKSSVITFLLVCHVCLFLPKSLTAWGSHEIMFVFVSLQTQRNPTRTRWMSPALTTALWRRSSGGRGLTSPASSSRSWKPPSRETATLTWAPERKSQCGPTSQRHGSGWVHARHRTLITAADQRWAPAPWLKVFAPLNLSSARCGVGLEWKPTNSSLVQSTQKP